MFYFYHRYFHVQYSCTPKITYSYWFLKIFFMLEKVPNISNYSVFDCFIFLSQSKRISYIFTCGVIYFFFQSKKISYIFNYVILYFFYLFKALNVTSLYTMKKNILIFLKIRIYYTPFKSVRKYHLQSNSGNFNQHGDYYVCKS